MVKEEEPCIEGPQAAVPIEPPQMGYFLELMTEIILTRHTAIALVFIIKAAVATKFGTLFAIHPLVSATLLLILLALFYVWVSLKDWMNGRGSRLTKAMQEEMITSNDVPFLQRGNKIRPHHQIPHTKVWH